MIAGSLPPGITLATNGTLSGVPTTAGTYSFTAQVADASSPPVTTSGVLSLTVASPTTITTASPLPSGTRAVAYSVALVATGGTPPYTWSLVSGTLPAGLSLSSAGVLSGIPTTAGTSNFTLRSKDSTKPTASSAMKAFALTIN